MANILVNEVIVVNDKFLNYIRVRLEDFDNYIETPDYINADCYVLKQDWGMHWHEFYELEYVSEGTGYNIMNGKQYIMRPGSFALLTPTDFHQTKVDQAITLMKIAFTENTIDPSIFTMLTKLNNVNLVCEDQKAKATFDAYFDLVMKADQIENTKNRDFIRKRLLECLLVYAVNIYIRENMFNENDFGGNDVMLDVMRYIHRNFHDGIDLKTTAEHVHLSSGYLSRLFSKTIGVPFKKYLNHIRLEFSKKLLFSTKFSVTEICFSSGFGSLSNFLREFKKKYGVSPREYKKQWERNRPN